MLRVVLSVLFVAVILAVVAAVDCALSARHEVRVVPKALWLLIVLIVPVVGPLLWFAMGRPKQARSGGDARPPAPTSPDDDPSFLRGLDAESRVRRLEEELARLEEEERGNPPADGRSRGPGDA